MWLQPSFCTLCSLTPYASLNFATKGKKKPLNGVKSGDEGWDFRRNEVQMQGVSKDSTHLFSSLRLVRYRLDELIERGALVQPDEISYIRRMIERVEEEHGPPQSIE